MTLTFFTCQGPLFRLFLQGLGGPHRSQIPSAVHSRELFPPQDPAMFCVSEAGLQILRVERWWGWGVVGGDGGWQRLLLVPVKGAGAPLLVLGPPWLLRAGLGLLHSDGLCGALQPPWDT